MDSAQPCRLVDLYPQLHDRTANHVFDAHYLYSNSWAMRRIITRGPSRHVDIGGQPILPALLGAFVPAVLVDYRPLRATVPGLTSLSGDILHLPLGDESIESLSCLHVAEHIGLGRYGDRLDADGTIKAARELARVLAPGGHLLFALPVGAERTYFNAHRVHAPGTIRQLFAELELLEHSGVHDDGRYVERVPLSEFTLSEYACGLFLFMKPKSMPAR